VTSYAFAAAGTGGHVVPALTVADELLRRGIDRSDIVFFGGARMAKQLVPQAGFEYVEVPLQGLRRSLDWRNLKLPVVLRQAVKELRQGLVARGCRVLLTTGGYAAIPAGRAAARTGVRFLIHEANAEPGLANRVAARWADRVFLAFPGGPLQGDVVGNPLRPELVDFDRQALRRPARARYGMPDEGPVLGVLGGSQGARVLNEQAAAVAARPGPTAGIVQLAGRGQVEEMQREAGGAAVPWRVLAFEDEMHCFYAASDLVLARAGAFTVSELGATATPAILVPRAAGSAGHQDRNAATLAEAGGAEIVDEATIDRVPDIVAGLFADPDRLARMRHSAVTTARVEATAALADAMQEAAGD
jgi:UDP-N-acetylglucosamine--N-acetylmuramyl-(pentapeptide) pyrophosphoryl-undecaprenol N-acetylglucosamine transferase